SIDLRPQVLPRAGVQWLRRFGVLEHSDHGHDESLPVNAAFVAARGHDIRVRPCADDRGSSSGRTPKRRETPIVVSPREVARRLHGNGATMPGRKQALLAALLATSLSLLSLSCAKHENEDDSLRATLERVKSPLATGTPHRLTGSGSLSPDFSFGSERW